MLTYRGPDNAPIGRSDLARALGFVALWRARPSNLATRKALTGTDSNGVSGVLTNKGTAYSLTGTGTGGISMPVPDSAPFTMLVMARSVTSGSSALGRVMSTFNGAGGNDWYYDGGSHNIQIFTASTNSTFTLPSSLLTGSTFQCVAISLSGVVGAQTPIAYADGVPVTVSTVAAGSGARVAGGTTLGVGYRPDTTGRQAGGVFLLAGYATRQLSARELSLITSRPDLLVAPRRIWVPVSAGGSDLLGQGVSAAAAQAAGEGRLLILGAGVAAAPAQAAGQGQALAQADGASQAEAQAIGAGQVLMLADGVAAGAAQAAGAGQSLARADGAADAAAQAIAVGDVVQPGVDTGVSDAPSQAIGQGALLVRADGVSSAASQAAGAGAALARADGAAQGVGQAAGDGQAVARADGVAAAPAQAIGSDASIEPPPPPPAPAVVTQPGYKHNPRTARDLDPLPPTGDDLADLVRDKWDAIERADAAIKRARGGDAPAQATVPTPAPAPAPRPSKRPAGAIAAAGLPLTDEQLRADEEAFILMVAEIL